MGGSLVLLLILFLGIGAAFAWTTRQFRADAAQEAAEALGLAVEGVDELVGTYESVGLRMYSRDHGGSRGTEWWSYTRCRLGDDLPEDLVVANQGFFGHMADLFGMRDIQLGNDLDPLLRISASHEEEVRELMNDPQVRQAMGAILGRHGRIELSGEELLVKVPGRHTERGRARARADEAVRVVNALAVATRARWAALAQEHGLAADDRVRQLTGTVRGVEVLVELDDRPRRTRVTAVLDRPLPAGTQVSRKDAGEGGERLGDPILDGMVVARSSDIAALAERVCADEVRGPLLEVVHGFPGSSLRADRVQLEAEGRLGERLEAAFVSVVDLAAALR